MAKPTKTAIRLAAQCRGGKSLHCLFRVNPKGEAVLEFFLEPGGRVVRRKTAEAAIEAGLLIAAGDGLFSGSSQTWIPKENAP